MFPENAEKQPRENKMRTILIFMLDKFFFYAKMRTILSFVQRREISVLFLCSRRQTRRITAALCAAALLCALAFIALHASHDCCGADCPVCALLKKGVFCAGWLLLSAPLLLLPAPRVNRGVLGPAAQPPDPAATPVKKKIRLNV